MNYDINAVDLTVNNLYQEFNSIGGDMRQFNVSYGESGLDILYRSVVTEALHDSGERGPEPPCHPGTRTAILEELSAWSIDTEPERTILWLHGSAGAGKSSIAQAFAADCQARGRLGASFFFRRGHPRRGTWNGLFPTIAYQLATAVPALRLPIQQALEQDKLIDGRSMAAQFQRLLVEPFAHAPAIEPTPILILDGLDECAHHSVQKHIIRLFTSAIRAAQLPVRILICSRPEPHLREIFQMQESSEICRHLELSADATAFEDIRIYLRDEFARIRSEFTQRGYDLGFPWPLPDAHDHLVRKSSGIFLYAVTVIRFIDDEYSRPTDRLDCVLALDPRSTVPLDDLYAQILSVVPQEPQQLLRVLHAIWRGTSPPLFGPCMDPEDFDTLLRLRRGTSRLSLRGLHSVIRVPPIANSALQDTAFLHESLADYLYDRRRSREWCISKPWLGSDYLECICMIHLCASPALLQYDRYDIQYSLPRTESNGH
ncbi:hypothetical protein B0H13DRAFT_1719797 [Mycena leptocephala]|nr:hypothetical protein B0H13DRAFT_1719797 [Mycena leptocephala]